MTSHGMPDGPRSARYILKDYVKVRAMEGLKCLSCVCVYVYMVCMYVCMYVVCMYVCMYVCCMYVCMCRRTVYVYTCVL